jgi:GMP synthase (glutamine-hydrolysing)
MRALFVCCGDPDPAVLQAHGPYVRWFRDALGDAATLHPVDARVAPCDPAMLHGVDAVIVSGSPHAVYEPHPWIAPLEELVREAIFRRGVPVLGVCFGHQLIAQACGGRVVRNPRGREIGTVEVALEPAGRSCALLGALPERFAIQVTHCDTVALPPPGARVLATSALDGCQAFRFETAWGVQFHPEVSADVMRAYLRSRAEILRAEGLDAAALLAGVRDTDAGPRLLRRFAELVVAGRAARSATDALHVSDATAPVPTPSE